MQQSEKIGNRRGRPPTRASAVLGGGDGGGVIMFDTEGFIAEVEKRPAIYDLHSEEYNDRTAKARAWDEVCEIMVPKWHALSELDKNAEGRWLLASLVVV